MADETTSSKINTFNEMNLKQRDAQAFGVLVFGLSKNNYSKWKEL
jgi:hypothetical protein